MLDVAATAAAILTRESPQTLSWAARSFGLPTATVEHWAAPASQRGRGLVRGPLRDPGRLSAKALFATLNVKHHFVRLWGLANRVVVLDEIHAYDTYTGGLIEALLRWLKPLGCSVVLTSATLPAKRRAALLAAWGAGDRPEIPYPRILTALVVLESDRIATLGRDLPAQPDRTVPTAVGRPASGADRPSRERGRAFAKCSR
jgi:hypothetical protein